jgi:membrane associated rhomboid family serine protease
MLSKHDELLLKDLKLQPVWLLWFYVVIGIAASIAGLVLLDWSAAAFACVGGGFLVALGAEKLVTRRVRAAARQAIAEGN